MKATRIYTLLALLLMAAGCQRSDQKGPAKNRYPKR